MVERGRKVEWKLGGAWSGIAEREERSGGKKRMGVEEREWSGVEWSGVEWSKVRKLNWRNGKSEVEEREQNEVEC